MGGKNPIPMLLYYHCFLKQVNKSNASVRKCAHYTITTLQDLPKRLKIKDKMKMASLIISMSSLATDPKEK